MTGLLPTLSAVCLRVPPVPALFRNACHAGLFASQEITGWDHLISVAADLASFVTYIRMLLLAAVAGSAYVLWYLRPFLRQPRRVGSALYASWRAFRHVLICEGGAVSLAYPSPGDGASVPSDFEKRFARLLGEADQITLVGVGLFVVRNTAAWARVKDRLKPGCKSLKLKICFGNVFSPSLIERFVEEGMGGAQKYYTRNDVASVVNQCAQELQLDVPQGADICCDLRVFSNFPTMGVIQLKKGTQEWSFFFVYPYRTLGNQNPVFEALSSHDVVGRFVARHMERVFADALPFKQHRALLKNPSTEEIGRISAEDGGYGCYAVFLIPAIGTRMYELLGPIVGWDCGEGLDIEPVQGVEGFAGHVGDAKKYGLHITIGHGLWLNDYGKDRLISTVRSIAKDLSKPVLRYSGVVRRNVHRRTVAVEFEDITGSAIVLHSELVVHVYPLALTTEFMVTAGRDLSQLRKRGKVMVGRYGVDNILDQFRLYATVLARDVDGDKGYELADSLGRYCQSMTDTQFAEVAIMKRENEGAKGGRWRKIFAVRFDDQPLRSRAFDGSATAFD